MGCGPRNAVWSGMQPLKKKKKEKNHNRKQGCHLILTCPRLLQPPAPRPGRGERAEPSVGKAGPGQEAAGWTGHTVAWPEVCSWSRCRNPLRSYRGISKPNPINSSWSRRGEGDGGLGGPAGQQGLLVFGINLVPSWKMAFLN